MARDPRECQPYIVATEPLWHALDRAPLGVPIPEANWFDPMRVRCERTIDRLDDHDAEVFGPLGMRMPRWALYDCAALPGAIFGLGVPSSEGLMPLSMCLLTPRIAAGEWLAYSISSVPADPALEVETLALAIAAVRATRMVATTQWDSPHLDVHARFAPLTLLACWIPVHTCATSFTYAIDITSERLERARRGDHPVEPATPIDPANLSQLHVLQARIEAGVRVEMVAAERHGEQWRALVREMP